MHWNLNYKTQKKSNGSEKKWMLHEIFSDFICSIIQIVYVFVHTHIFGLWVIVSFAQDKVARDEHWY